MIGGVSTFSGFVGGGVLGLLIGIFAILMQTYVKRFQLGTEAKVADESIADGQWKRFQNEIARLDARINHLEDEVEQCRKREQEWIRRAIKAEAEAARLEALNLGRGEAHQEAQRIVSEERTAEKRSGGAR